MTSERVYNLSQAAAACGVSLPTIRRRKAVLEEHGATVDPSGWVIPHAALVAAGLSPDWEPGGQEQLPVEEPQEAHQWPQPEDVAPEPNDELREALDRVRRLESELLVARHLIDKWQVIASDRLDQLNTLRPVLHALGMLAPPRELEARPAVVEHDEKPQEPATAPPEPEKRGWWGRLVYG